MPILFFIIILVVLIIGHEFGHFLAAKISGMRVLEFGLGFPPKLWGKKMGGTLYTVNALPFGGFVKIFGEDAEEDFKDPRAFSNRSVLSQAIVIFSGPFMNVLLAYFFAVTALMIGVPHVIDPAHPISIQNERVIVGNVLQESPAQKAGIHEGDVVLSVSDASQTVDIKTPAELVELLSNAEGQVEINLVRAGNILSIAVTPKDHIVPEEPDRKVIGIATALIGTVSYGPLEALSKGFTDTLERGQEVLTGLWTLLSGALTLSSDLSGVAGPVGIASIAGQAALLGVGSFLSLISVISINLAVINLFPFPALDGGRLAVLIVESALRRKIPHRYANAANYLGFVLLLLLMVAVTAHDIIRLAS